MNVVAKPRTESGKGELRRQQVLDAATECFRREGFHGSSISRISQAAGMSPGHIYHYFSSKEAIVEAIAERAEREIAELVRRMENDQEGGDLVARLTRHTGETVERNSDLAHVGLMLELAAEGARNPAVAAILRRTDQMIQAQFLDMARRVGLPRGLDEAALRLRMGLVATLLNGLALRVVVEPQYDRAATTCLINGLVSFLFEESRNAP